MSNSSNNTGDETLDTVAEEPSGETVEDGNDRADVSDTTDVEEQVVTAEADGSEDGEPSEAASDTGADESGPVLEVIDGSGAPVSDASDKDGVSRPLQSEMPFAVVEGEPYTQLPQDLYIPPHALKIFLEAFEGPLDLLLYLIKRQNLDILFVPIAEITRQYTEYIDLMQDLQLELAGEYLVMAAMLAEIKSRMLLPRMNVEEGEEEDPRAELVRRLQEYERYKKAAEDLDSLPRMERDTYAATAEVLHEPVEEVVPEVDLREVLIALQEVIRRAEMYKHHQVDAETLSVREKMSDVLSRLSDREFHDFAQFFDVTEGRMGIVVTFLAILELVKESLIELVQSEPFAPIHLRTCSDSTAKSGNE